jgi:hypothetical protein
MPSHRTSARETTGVGVWPEKSVGDADASKLRERRVRSDLRFELTFPRPGTAGAAALHGRSEQCADRIGCCGERFVDFVRIFAACLGQVGLAATFSADDRRETLDECAC